MLPLKIRRKIIAFDKSYRAHNGDQLIIQFANDLKSNEKGSIKNFWDTLTKRDQKIINHIGEGKSLEELGSMLTPAPSTISTHRKHILGKIKDDGYEVNRIDHPIIINLVKEYGLLKKYG